MTCCSRSNKTGTGSERHRRAALISNCREVPVPLLLQQALPAVLVVTVLVTAAAGARAAEPRRLTDDGRLKLAPVFLGDGSEIAYSVHDIPNRLTLMRLKLAD